jgi:hypothetical protein
LNTPFVEICLPKSQCFIGPIAFALKLRELASWIRANYRFVMPSVSEIERMALSLTEPERAILAATLLGSLSPATEDVDEGIAEALARDAQLDADSGAAMGLEDLDRRISSRR